MPRSFSTIVSNFLTGGNRVDQPINISSMPGRQESESQPSSIFNDPIDANIISNRDPSLTGATTSAGIFGYFAVGDIIPDNKQDVTEAAWSGGVGGTMTDFFSSSLQYSGSGRYYANIYNLDPQTDTTAEVQFAVAYGHYYGSGSALINALSGNVSLTPTKAIYSQYSNLLLPITSDKFIMGDSTSPDEIIVVNLDRARIKQQLDAGNWELLLGSATADSIQLIDESIVGATGTITEGGKVYNIISGSLATLTAYDNGGSYVYYGLMYPEHGTLILNATAVSASLEMPLDRTTAGSNNAVIYDSLNLGAGFAARNSQTINSTYYFVRVKNSAFNFSNNPSFTTGSYGDLRHAEMVSNPNVYITTVGLYNDNNELLAVAKISRPILKTFNSEALLRIKLDF